MRIAEAKFIVQGFLKVVILEHSGQDMMKLLLIREFSGNCGLRLMQFCRGHHFHGGCYLQCIFD